MGSATPRPAPRLLLQLGAALLLFTSGGAERASSPHSNRVHSFEPQFLEPLQNVTVTEGREATFTCVVDHLGGYRVAWIKADTKAILAIHNRVITHNNRMNVIHSDHKTWELKIKDVRRNDSGEYMCQINTDPMKHQVGHLNVVIPPDIIAEESSGDVMVSEGNTVRLVCRARGYPEPRVEWRREDGRKIALRPAGQSKNEVQTWEGSELILERVTRDDMGAYLCIASNEIPPAVSKRMVVQVHFHPVVRIPNQLVGAPVGTNVTLECEVEASPKSINFWTKIMDEQGPQIVDSRRYVNKEIEVNQYTLKMHLTILDLEEDDFTHYSCTAKNSLGEVKGKIKLYEIPLPKPLTTPQEVMVGTVGGEDDNLIPHTRHDQLIPLTEDKQAASPRQGKPSATRPPPPSRPRNTHAVPYSPEQPRGDRGTGAGAATPLLGLLLAALLVVIVVPRVSWYRGLW
ncbi:lachesin-like isoform X4 [Portunus trituberculatus]|uniref:lachesin-like isoform X4 n=1 Tax=Portunus trituberculatus TaxID=210409 RepID=UPI001E1D1C81|nr:lachesin-like isoform X4 [Portunus trituberculatus]